MIVKNRMKKLRSYGLNVRRRSELGMRRRDSQTRDFVSVDLGLVKRQNQNNDKTETHATRNSEVKQSPFNCDLKPNPKIKSYDWRIIFDDVA